MPEYVVDCEHVPMGDALLVLPIVVNGHVHERVVRCRDCAHSRTLDVRGEPMIICYYRKAMAHTTEPGGFCKDGVPKGGDW